MTEAEGIFDAGAGRLYRDRVTDAFLAMRDAWVYGMAAAQNVSRQAMAGGNPETARSGASLLDPMMGILGAMADLANANGQRFARPGSEPATSSAAGGRGNSIAAEVVLPLSQAMMVAASRSASYWLNLAQIVASHEARILQAAGPDPAGGRPAGSVRLVAADEVRALLREVGDLATREARILQNELGALTEALVESHQQPDPSAPYRRRWRAKV